MRTGFSALQLLDPHLSDAEKSLRACMHCGICTATCPTYALLGDERDGPRGRIVMMQEMLQSGDVNAETVLHVDRCLSCLACRTACPSNVDYARLVDAARAHIESHYRRPIGARLSRWFIANVMTQPRLLGTALVLARRFASVAPVLPRTLRVILEKGAAVRTERPHRLPAAALQTHERPVGVFPCCVQEAVAPGIDEALTRILARRGISAMSVQSHGCCGALSHHMGRTEEAKACARRAIETFESGEKRFGYQAITISATGCAAHMADYPGLFRGDAEWELRGKALAAKFRDVSLLIDPKPSTAVRRRRVALHSPCSARNALMPLGEPRALLEAAGFDVALIPEDHLCCGSAGSYSLLQPEISEQLKMRKLGNIASVTPDLIATGNIGCLIQLSSQRGPAVVHYVELLDWAEGGPKPAAMRFADVEGPRSRD